jgi:MFS family permease
MVGVLIRRLAGIVYVTAPFLGPCLGPVTCGFLAQTQGWKWVEGLIALLCGVCLLLGLFIVPETYAPVLLKQRAAKLTQVTGLVYRSKLEADAGASKNARELFNLAMVRPWILLAKEPIVLLLSLYIAISTCREVLEPFFRIINASPKP